MKLTQKSEIEQEYLSLGIVMFHLPLGETPLHFRAIPLMLQSGGEVADHLVFALN